jgi:hypothetical protein
VFWNAQISPLAHNVLAETGDEGRALSPSINDQATTTTSSSKAVVTTRNEGRALHTANAAVAKARRSMK